MGEKKNQSQPKLKRKSEPARLDIAASSIPTRIGSVTFAALKRKASILKNPCKKRPRHGKLSYSEKVLIV